MKKKLRIILLTDPSNQKFPLRTEIAEVFGKYLSQKHQFISMHMKKSVKQHFFWNGIEFYLLPPYNFFKRTFQLLRSHKFDAIFTRNHPFLLLFGWILKIIYGIPLIFHFTVPYRFITVEVYKWYHPKYLVGIFFHILILKIMKYTNLILPTSEWMEKYLISQKINPNKLFVFPNGTNLSLFKPKKYLSSLKNPKFIYIGIIDKRRKLDILIYAMKIVTETIKNAHLLMVGKGTAIENLKKITIKLNLEKNITFIGLVPYKKVPDYISNTHIALCPLPPNYCYKLSTPLKLFEYMSCSRPVIANKEIPTHLKTIKESKSGLLVDYTPESFAKAMLKLCQNPEKSKVMGINGRKWVEKNRSYKKLASDFEKRIFKILNNR